MIHGPFSEESFWDEEPDSDPEIFDPWSDALSPQSPDDWQWEEWDDFLVFRPVGLEPRYRYPLILWLSFDEVVGTTLRDWFPDLSDRNYLGAEIRLSSQVSPELLANRVRNVLGEIKTFYNIHNDRVWIAGVGRAGDRAADLPNDIRREITGSVILDPSPETITFLGDSANEIDHQGVYLALTEKLDQTTREFFEPAAKHAIQRWRVTDWETIVGERLSICRDLNDWLMQHICAPASGHDPR